MARSKRKNIDELPQYSFHDLRLGDNGRAVAFTQWILKQMGWYNGAIDGIFGQKTLLAVRKFQSARKLTVSGVVDRPTRYALYGDAVDKGILKSMPTPYYVNNWKPQEQATETSHETTPGTSTQVLEYTADNTFPQTGSVIAPTTPEHSQQLPEGYQPSQLLQQPYFMPQQTPGTPQFQYPISQPLPGTQQFGYPMPQQLPESQQFGYPTPQQLPESQQFGYPAMPEQPQGSQQYPGYQQIQTQQIPQQPAMLPGYTAAGSGQTPNLPFGMADYWNQVYQQQQREYFAFYLPYRWDGFAPYPAPWF